MNLEDVYGTRKLEDKLPKEPEQEDFSFTYKLDLDHPESQLKYDKNYLPENVKFVIQYEVDSRRGLLGYTSFSKDDEDIFIPVSPGGESNISYHGVDFWKVVAHEDGHNSSQRSYQITPEKEESDLRSARGE